MKKLLLLGALVASASAAAGDANYLELALGQLQYQVSNDSLQHSPSGDAAYLELAYSYPLSASFDARFSVASTNRSRWGNQTDTISAGGFSSSVDSSRESRFSNVGAAVEWHSAEVSKGFSYAARAGVTFWQDDQQYKATITSTTNPALQSQKNVLQQRHEHDQQLTFSVGAVVQYHLDQHDSINIGLDYSTASLNAIDKDALRSFDSFDYELLRVLVGFRHRY